MKHSTEPRKGHKLLMAKKKKKEKKDRRKKLILMLLCSLTIFWVIKLYIIRRHRSRYQYAGY